jgi:hypothetical protein
LVVNSTAVASGDAPFCVLNSAHVVSAVEMDCTNDGMAAVANSAIFFPV